jgi:hypothetical protein
MIYDNIYVGTSIPMLFYIYMNLDDSQNDLIINKEKFIGGSWNIVSNEYCKNFDTAGHFIVIRDKNKLKNVLSLFKKLNIEIETQNPEIHNDNYKFIYDSHIFYPKNGWDVISTTLIKKINKNILFNHEIIKINIFKNVNLSIKHDNKISETTCRKIIIPSYIKLNQIKINKDIIPLNYTLCTTYHIVFFCYIEKNLKYNNSYHGFFDGNLFFDRFTCVCNDEKMVNKNNVNQLLILRVSRKCKNILDKITKEQVLKYFWDFIKKQNIELKEIIVQDFKIYDYSFYYRQEIVKKLIKEFNNFKNIQFIDTTDLGKLIELLI